MTPPRVFEECPADDKIDQIHSITTQIHTALQTQVGEMVKSLNRINFTLFIFCGALLLGLFLIIVFDRYGIDKVTDFVDKARAESGNRIPGE